MDVITYKQEIEEPIIRGVAALFVLASIPTVLPRGK
jgi:hypothetical protein